MSPIGETICQKIALGGCRIHLLFLHYLFTYPTRLSFGSININFNIMKKNKKNFLKWRAAFILRQLVLSLFFCWTWRLFHQPRPTLFHETSRLRASQVAKLLALAAEADLPTYVGSMAWRFRQGDFMYSLSQ